MDLREKAIVSFTFWWVNEPRGEKTPAEKTAAETPYLRTCLEGSLASGGRT
jgi:hypothetical protein